MPQPLCAQVAERRDDGVVGLNVEVDEGPDEESYAPLLRRRAWQSKSVSSVRSTAHRLNGHQSRGARVAQDTQFLAAQRHDIPDADRDGPVAPLRLGEAGAGALAECCP